MSHLSNVGPATDRLVPPPLRLHLERMPFICTINFRLYQQIKKNVDWLCTCCIICVKRLNRLYHFLQTITQLRNTLHHLEHFFPQLPSRQHYIQITIKSFFDTVKIIAPIRWMLHCGTTSSLLHFQTLKACPSAMLIPQFQKWEWEVGFRGSRRLTW